MANARHDAGGPVAVATAMTLREGARARLSKSLGSGFPVIDIRVAPATANVVLAQLVIPAGATQEPFALGKFTDRWPQRP